ncbi:MAG TPA: hypothetical protein VIM69_04400 [Opitutaceae bacterium]
MGAEAHNWRVTPTNAGPDSKGIVSVFGWDLEGMVAFYLVGGALVGMLLIFTLTGQPILTRIVSGVVPVIASALWVKFFVHGRPPSYQSDVFEKWLRGSGFGLRPQQWTRQRHPRVMVFQKQLEAEARHGGRT